MTEDEKETPPSVGRVSTKPLPPVSRDIVLQVASPGELAIFFRAGAEIAEACANGHRCRVTIIVERLPPEPLTEKT